MLDFLINSVVVCIVVLMAFGVFFVAQIVTERFILKTVPIIAEVYLRLRHPERYRDE